MTVKINSQAHLSIDGETLDEIELLRWELDRSRVAHLLLKKNLGPDRIRELLKDETQTSTDLFQRWVEQSDGKFLPATAELTAEGGSAAGFVKWFGAVTAASDEAHLLGAMPEHYLILPTEKGQEVIETFGGWGLPVHFSIEFTDDISEVVAADAVDEDYPVRLMGFGYAGDRVKVGAVLHQFANTETGFKAKLAIYYPAASDPTMIEGHRHHLACEFTNWVNMYLASEGLRQAD